jgi:hypothetical protein
MQSRRVFLKNGAFAFVSLGFAPGFLARTALAADGPGRARRLIAIFQRGAVDGLNMVVPFGDAEYYRARPSIAIAKPGDAEFEGFVKRHFTKDCVPERRVGHCLIAVNSSTIHTPKADFRKHFKEHICQRCFSYSAFTKKNYMLPSLEYGIYNVSGLAFSASKKRRFINGRTWTKNFRRFYHKH